jgi:hypothetical protein
MERKDKVQLLEVMLAHTKQMPEPAARKPSRAWNPERGCYYREFQDTASGNRCLIGCLIRDEDYTPTMENKRASSDIIMMAVGKAYPDMQLNGMDGAWLEHLQQMHDRASDIEQLEWDVEAELQSELNISALLSEQNIAQQAKGTTI